MIEDVLEELANRLDHRFKVDTGRLIIPTAEDYRKILDHAATVLYDEPIGSSLRLRSLIVEKQQQFLDVYAHVGIYY